MAGGRGCRGEGRQADGLGNASPNARVVALEGEDTGGGGGAAGGDAFGSSQGAGMGGDVGHLVLDGVVAGIESLGTGA